MTSHQPFVAHLSLADLSSPWQDAVKWKHQTLGPENAAGSKSHGPVLQRHLQRHFHAHTPTVAKKHLRSVVGVGSKFGASAGITTKQSPTLWRQKQKHAETLRFKMFKMDLEIIPKTSCIPKTELIHDLISMLKLERVHHCTVIDWRIFKTHRTWLAHIASKDFQKITTPCAHYIFRISLVWLGEPQIFPTRLPIKTHSYPHSCTRIANS